MYVLQYGIISYTHSVKISYTMFTPPTSLALSPQNDQVTPKELPKMTPKRTITTRPGDKDPTASPPRTSCHP